MQTRNDRVDAWMTSEVVTLEPEATVGEAARRLAGQMVSCVLVVEEGRPIGIVTERDVSVCVAVRAVSSLEDVTVAEIMGAPLVSVRPDDFLSTALERVENLLVRHVPVLDAKGCLLGILTQTDLLRACASLAGLTQGSSR